MITTRRLVFRRNLSRLARVLGAVALFAASAATAAHAGPVILGGDDNTAHGSGDGATNHDGWLYIEHALTDLDANVTRLGPFTVDVAALGSADVGCPTTCPLADAGAAIGSATAGAGLTVSYVDGAAALQTFFIQLASGVVNPRVIWLAGSGTNNDLEADEGLVLTVNAHALAAFVDSGGGLMAHGSGPIAYGWLEVLLPGLVENGGCSASQARRTAIGTAAFPTVTDADVASGPCHTHFAGNFGNLRVVALDGSNFRTCVGGPDEGKLCSTDADCPGAAACATGAPFMLGGGQNTVFTTCGDNVLDAGEQCDGTASAACPGRCLPPTSALACQCSLCGASPDPACTPPSLSGKAPFKMINHENDEADAVVWVWAPGDADFAQFGDPTLNTAYQLCVYDQTELISTAVIPAGGLCGEPKKPKPCWRQTATGFKYKNGAFLPMGVKTLKLKAGQLTGGSIKLTAKGDLVEVPAQFPLDLPVTVQLKNSTTAACWDATYSDNVMKNTPGSPASKFRAKAN